ncbi:hypothetical protein [Pontibacter ramchanderi]|uniref:Uncharacterized protein n=1 Tax=Pontibacter ramchanderi TaxID=1179743 RepID=A0A2N3U6M2_9BACT|nr:hypothetical protein [Pontibacter ramchanderi]PKV62391.1 hypothetical protein BD749_3892 [Pontibacter ramchanderi]
MNLEEDDYARIQLVSFDYPAAGKERYYFLEMSSLQATTLLEPALKIKRLEIVAYDSNDNYLSTAETNNFKTLSDFNTYFLKNPDFYIHNLEMELENGSKINSHDDGEVSITIAKDSEQIEIIKRVLKNYKIQEDLITEMKRSPEHYLAIDSVGKVVADYSSFDEYVEKGRKQIFG